MIKNYFKTAIRSLIKNKFYSFLNISGLAIGIGCSILIFLFVQNELSVDSFNDNYDRIYRIGADINIGDRALKIAEMPAPAAETFLNEYPEIEQVVRFRASGSYMTRYKDISFKEDKILFADSTLFDVFSFKVLQGETKTALSAPYSIALSSIMAKKYFGNINPLGKTLKLDNKYDYNVTAVFEDLPKNSHIEADFFASLNSRDEANDKSQWLSFNFPTYIVLKENAQIERVDEKFASTIKTYCEPLFVKFIGKSIDELEKAGGHTFFYSEPLSDVYLHTDGGNELGTLGDIQYVFVFTAIAFFVLVIACINFVNLSTAHSSGRAKEVGIRKTLGSFRKDLIAQFIFESILLSSLATLIAIILVEFSLPGFNELSSRNIEANYLGNSLLLTLLFLLPPLVGLIAGIYPAFIISGFQPVSILKGSLKTGMKSGLLRSSLVVLQFSSSIILLVGTITVFEQLGFIQNTKIGYERDQVLILNDAYLLGDQVESFKNEMLANSGISTATISSFLPVPSSRNNTAVFPNNQQNHPKTSPMYIFTVDYDYIKTLGMEIKEGRDFSREFLSDSSAIIMNEAAAKHFEWDTPLENSIGLFINGQGDTKSYNVIGVVKDFNFQTMHQEVGPLVMVIGNSKGYISFRLSSDNLNNVINDLENKWKEFLPTQPFAHSFLDERFNKMYKAEQKLGEIFGVFAGLAIFIGCLGLFGLSAFTAQRRTKEIGIRKVMGASVSGIVTLMGSEFVKLILISFLIASPIAYYLMKLWLEDFAYRVDLGAYVFLLSGTLSFMIAILTVSYHSLKSALTNPIDSIRYE